MPARPVRATLAVLAIALCVNSCSPGGSSRNRAAKAAQEKLNQSEVTRIDTELSKDPRIMHPDMGYSNVWPDSGEASLGAVISPDDRKHIEEIISLCARSVWLSKLSPLRSIHVLVSWRNADGTGDEVDRDILQSTADAAALTKLYGNRPGPN